MSIETVRERLHEYISFADDKKVEAIYIMVEDEIIDHMNLWENADFLKELKNRLDDFESGKTQGISWEEVKHNARLAANEKPSIEDKMALMQQAQNDPLFLADLKEITDDFDFINSEHI